ncbi:MAG: hypothetical protein ACK5MG_02880 [Bacteroidales bacterium]
MESEKLFSIINKDKIELMSLVEELNINNYKNQALINLAISKCDSLSCGLQLLKNLAFVDNREKMDLSHNIEITDTDSELYESGITEADITQTTQMHCNGKEDRDMSATEQTSLRQLLMAIDSKEGKLAGASIKSIKAEIGLNDKFLFIRELFDNNFDKYIECVDGLDAQNNLDCAISFLQDKYTWVEDTSALTDFLKIVKRRFL